MSKSPPQDSPSRGKPSRSSLARRGSPSRQDSPSRGGPSRSTQSRRARPRLTYILLLFLPRRRVIRVGRLGRIPFDKGFYFYVGSGGRTPHRRLARHVRRRKRKFWHIDYLTVHSKVIGALMFEHEKSLECGLAGALSEVFTPITGFGASDCRCESHLFHYGCPGSG